MQQLDAIKQMLAEHVPASHQSHQQLHQLLDGIKEEFTMLDFKVQRYIEEKEVIIRMLEANVEEQKEQKREIAEVNRLLVQRSNEIKVQNEQLAKANHIAQEALQSKNEFLSTMSHEIRTPLNAIIGISFHLLESNPKPEQIQHLNILKFSGENLLSLVNDILDYSKIEAGKVELENNVFNLPEFLTQLVAMYQVRAKEKQVKLQAKLNPNLPIYVSGDVNRLNQVLSNLLSNAIKFTPQGSVTLEVSTFESFSDHARIVFQVQDSGIGIAPDKIPVIFDSFVQASNDTTRKFGGTGLGLAITKRLLELMNSSIEVQSTLGQGSTFYFTLDMPIATAPAEKVQHHKNSTADLRGCKILLVEDNELNIVVAKNFLDSWGTQVHVARTGTEGIHMSDSNLYDAVLLDLQLPDMHGIDVAKYIRSAITNAKTPIIALTATVTSTVRADAFAAGMNDYLAKPFNPNDLQQKLLYYCQQ
jgi:signal transduction histidine kinase/ActR/RegA family two-component response regulator